MYEILWNPAVGALIGLLLGSGGAVGVVNYWQRRKQPAADIQETEARTQETKARTLLHLAEVREHELESNLTAGDIVLRMMDEMRVAQSSLNAMAERQRELDNKLAQCNEIDARCKLLDMQLKRAAAVLSKHGLTKEFSDIIIEQENA